MAASLNLGMTAKLGEMAKDLASNYQTVQFLRPVWSGGLLLAQYLFQEANLFLKGIGAWRN